MVNRTVERLNVRVEQAIFTSVRGSRNAGYQLAAASPGICSDDARNLIQWGPSHNSVCASTGTRNIVSYRPMNSGSYCLSCTNLAGPEYSGRGGERVYTHFFVLSPPVLTRFADNPFRIIEALIASGHTETWDEIPPQMQAIELIGRASAIQIANVQSVSRRLGPMKLATLVHAALATESLGIIESTAPRQLLSVLIDLLPPAVRRHFSLTTGLRVSSRRPFRLHVLSNEPEELRRAVRQLQMTLLSLAEDPPAQYAPRDGWPAKILELLQTRRYQTLARIMTDTDQATTSNRNAATATLES